MSYILKESNGDSIENLDYSDLISNLSLFNQSYTSKRLSELEDFSDDSDYSTYPSIEEIIENYDPEIYDGKTFVVKVDEKYIFSSDSEKNGYDRPKSLLRKSNDDICRKNLRKKNQYNQLGWSEADSNTLNGWIRVQEIVNGNINSTLGVSKTPYLFTLVKNMGNHRFWMKKIANKGGRCEYLIKIQFHNLSTITNPILTEEYVRIEATGHDNDAAARVSQNEQQKFVSAYRSQVKEVIDCFNFLKDMEIEYHITKEGHGIMQQEGYNENGDWPVIHSIQGLRDGLSNGLFKKYGFGNVKASIGACRLLCKITGEDGFSYSAISILSLMYRSLTDDHTKPGDDRKSPVIFNKPQLLDFFKALYTMRNSKETSSFSFGPAKFSQLANLSQSKGMKSWPYIASVAFWPEIQAWYKDQVNNGNGEHGFSDGKPGMRYFIDQADAFVKGEVKKNVS
tara:strand:+ start:266 stop:1621 length:1356 start_codon:yes stop_codon:yes gene_type:complete